MNIKEFNTCVDNHADGVYRFILKSIRDEEKAKDIVQDSFEKMWVKVREITAEKAKTYLYTTAYHTMVDLIRKESKKAFFENEHLNLFTTENLYSDLKEILDQAVAKLPEIQRSVILLRDYEGYSYEEIGEITGLSESQVKVYIFRARNFLKNFIGSMETVL